MSYTDNLKDILSQQENIAIKLDSVIKDINHTDIVSENDSLKNELKSVKVELDKIRAENSNLSIENKNLKTSLYEQIYNEKISILNLVNKKIDAYYVSKEDDEKSRLLEFEIKSKIRIDEMFRLLYSSNITAKDELRSKIEELDNLLKSKITFLREELAKFKGAFSENKDKEYLALHQEGITGQEINTAVKKNNIESLIGLNIINKLGILFLIIGVITGMQILYFNLTDEWKSVCAFSVGIILLIIGELLNKKKSNVFAQGISSGGIAILNVALAISYFGLNVIELYPALAICIAISALAFYLSIRYNSETIASFALIGGYLPIIGLSSSIDLIYPAMAYFVILNVFAFLLSFHKKWSVLQFISFGLNIIATIIVMVLIAQIVEGLEELTADGVLIILYIIFAFIIYSLLPIISNYKKHLHFNKYDILLIGLNTIISAVLLYIQFAVLDLNHLLGYLSAIFALIYVVLARYLQVKMPYEKKIHALFYITSFTFFTLIVPLHFDIVWLSLGWVIQGVSLLTYGIFRNDKNFSKAGYIICALCLASFLILDLIPGLIGTDPLFVYKYFAVTLGSIIIVGSYAVNHRFMSKNIIKIKYFTFVNLWLFLLYFVFSSIGGTMTPESASPFNLFYILSTISIVIGFALAFTIPRIKSICDYTIKVISSAIYTICILWLFIMNMTISPMLDGVVLEASLSLLNVLIILAICTLSVFALKDMLKCLVIERKINIEKYPLSVSAYIIIILTQILVAQFDVPFSSYILSIIYIVSSLAWVVTGFVKRYNLIRKFGLGLSFIAMAKLFIIDLWYLTGGLRIVSYFAFGIILIAISFVYQYFSKRLESRTLTPYANELENNDKTFD